jgi:hypothetical protein
MEEVGEIELGWKSRYGGHMGKVAQRYVYSYVLVCTSVPLVLGGVTWNERMSPLHLPSPPRYKSRDKVINNLTSSFRRIRCAFKVQDGGQDQGHRHSTFRHSKTELIASHFHFLALLCTAIITDTDRLDHPL